MSLTSWFGKIKANTPAEAECLRQPKALIWEYTRDADRRRIGVVVALKEGERVVFGWSKCCTKDQFDKEFGIAVAVRRAYTRAAEVREHDDEIPRQIKKHMERFYGRALRYFKLTPEAAE